jgi:hypothetical protein
MQAFESLSESQLMQLLREKEELSLLISESTLKFKQHIPDISFEFHKEIPPTPSIFSAEGLAEIACHTDNDVDGKYIRFVVSVYVNGGRILYKLKSSDEYEVKVMWDVT